MAKRRHSKGSPQGGRFASGSRPDDQTTAEVLSLPLPKKDELNYEYVPILEEHHKNGRISTGKIIWTFPEVEVNSTSSKEDQAFFGSCPRCEQHFEDFFYSNLVTTLQLHVLRCYREPIVEGLALSRKNTEAANRAQ